MICPKCQTKNPEGSAFCLNCGASLVPKQSPSFLSRHKGWLIAILIVLIFLVLPALFFLKIIISVGPELAKQAEKEALISGSGEDKIALVNIDGIIMEKEPTRGLGAVSEEVTSARRMKKVLKEISNDTKVKALILRVNSPGGSAVASEEIYQDLLAFKKTTGKKIVVYFSDLAASGGYYVSLAADKIIASPSNITGSMGVIISYLNFQELAEKYGVKNIVYKSGPHKDIISEIRQPTEEEKAIMQGLISDSYDNFVKAISQGRGLPESEVRKLADGRLYSAKQAKELRLVDELGSLEEAIVAAKNLAGLKEASVVEYGQANFWELLLGNLSWRFNLSFLPILENYFNFKPGLRILYLYTP